MKFILSIACLALMSNNFVYCQDSIVYVGPDYNEIKNETSLFADSIFSIKIIGKDNWGSKGYYLERLPDSVCKNNDLPVYAVIEKIDSNLFDIKYRFRNAKNLQFDDTCAIYSWGKEYIALPVKYYPNHGTMKKESFEWIWFILTSTDERDPAFYCRTENKDKITLYQDKKR